jgi:hypothetical protein|tara:strand:- start:60 stop:332 length:273 start_codon:yes stop_codon:yes gene_type:complete
MNELETILRKNQLHILIIEAEQKAKTKKQFKALHILNDSLLLLNQQHELIEALNKHIGTLKHDNSKLMLDNAILKKENNTLNKQIKDYYD